MHKILGFLNDNHWYIIALVILTAVIFWTYGCESQTTSLLDPGKKINRAGLQNEVNYILGQAQIKADGLDKQDEIKQAILDAFNIIGQTGNVNPSGLINLAASVGAIAFGLNRNQKYKNVRANSNSTG